MNKITKGVVVTMMLMILGTLVNKYISDLISTSLINTFSPIF